MRVLRLMGASMLAVVSVATGGHAAEGDGAMSPSPAATGRTGRYYQVDTRSTPGANCVYAGASLGDPLRRIWIRAPKVFARDRRAGLVDRQSVGWRYIIQGSSDGLFWQRKFRSSLRKAIATDRTPADFSSRTWTAHSVNYQTRVQLQIMWYRDGKVVGRAKVRTDYYRYKPLGSVFNGLCASQ